ncbi:uncharacterized protein LOC111350116 [Spodoptera litura]|uniref:Uncharacterized protein LOC111350116 n=1 Tax=Spodoptera litura TaxID=69820 RepID=A0A9J7DRW6_SPOLT|nr:uncharacterized protein LOC111350116 [Spodoptera litura]
MAYIPVDELPNLAAMNIEVIPVPNYQNPYLYDPWYYQRMMMGSWSSYPRTTGSVHFGGQVEGRGGVSIRGDFGNNGYNKVTSYSASSTPVVVTPEPTLPDSDWPIDSILPNINLPKVTSLPEIAYPSIKSDKSDMPLPVPKIRMPDNSLPIIMALSKLTEESFIEIRNLGYCSNDDDDENEDEEPGPVVFGGKVPASGRIRISANF